MAGHLEELERTAPLTITQHFLRKNIFITFVVKDIGLFIVTFFKTPDLFQTFIDNFYATLFSANPIF